MRKYFCVNKLLPILSAFTLVFSLGTSRLDPTLIQNTLSATKELGGLSTPTHIQNTMNREESPTTQQQELDKIRSSLKLKLTAKIVDQISDEQLRLLLTHTREVTAHTVKYLLRKISLVQKGNNASQIARVIETYRSPRKINANSDNLSETDIIKKQTIGYKNYEDYDYLRVWTSPVLAQFQQLIEILDRESPIGLRQPSFC